MYYLLNVRLTKLLGKKMSVFCDVTPCSLGEVYRRFRGAEPDSLIMEEASTTEILVNFYHIIRYNITRTVTFILATVRNIHLTYS
jgi:hypothetical protein